MRLLRLEREVFAWLPLGGHDRQTRGLHERHPEKGHREGNLRKLVHGVAWPRFARFAFDLGYWQTQTSRRTTTGAEDEGKKRWDRQVSSVIFAT